MFTPQFKFADVVFRENKLNEKLFVKVRCHQNKYTFSSDLISILTEVLKHLSIYNQTLGLFSNCNVLSANKNRIIRFWKLEQKCIYKIYSRNVFQLKTKYYKYLQST